MSNTTMINLMNISGTLYHVIMDLAWLVRVLVSKKI